MRKTKVERELTQRLNAEWDMNMKQDQFKKGYDNLKSQDKNNDRAALAAHYEQELRDKERMAREIRA